MTFERKQSTQTLSSAIKWKRFEMIALGTEHGLQDSRTVKSSQELDVLLNQHLLSHTLQNNQYAG